MIYICQKCSVLFYYITIFFTVISLISTEIVLSADNNPSGEPVYRDRGSFPCGPFHVNFRKEPEGRWSRSGPSSGAGKSAGFPGEYSSLQLLTAGLQYTILTSASLKQPIVFISRACLQSTLSFWFSSGTWVCFHVSILWPPLCCCSTTSQRFAQMPISFASSLTSPSLPRWPTWAYGRSDIVTQVWKCVFFVYFFIVGLCNVVTAFITFNRFLSFLQLAFEVLSFISVMSNCWLLLLSPRVKDLTQDAGLSGGQVLVFAVFIEVRIVCV